jgi:hypothetical protein
MMPVMRNWLRHLPIVILCTALFTGYAGKAQVSKAGAEEGVPAKIHGNWALPDCKSYEEALIITRHFYLRSDKDGSQLWPLSASPKHGDYWIMPMEGAKHPVSVQADGVLKIGLLDSPPKKWPKSWDALQMDSHREYMDCAEIPAIIPDPLVRAMKHIDEIENACHGSLSDSCRQVLFTIADENKDKKISVREMKNAAAMLASMALLAKDHAASRDALDKTVYQSLQEADKIAARLMPDGREAGYKDFEGFPAKANSAALREALADIGKIIPGLKGK